MDDAKLDELIGWLRELHDYSMDEAADAITALRAERDALAKDAARYRWLQQTRKTFIGDGEGVNRAWNMLELGQGTDDALDGAIDAAMQAEADRG